MKSQVLTDMPDNELHDLLAAEREQLIKNENESCSISNGESFAN